MLDLFGCVSDANSRVRERLGQRVLQRARPGYIVRKSCAPSCPSPLSPKATTVDRLAALGPSPQPHIFHSPILLFAFLLCPPKLCFVRFFRLCCLVVCERNRPPPDRPP